MSRFRSVGSLSAGADESGTVGRSVAGACGPGRLFCLNTHYCCSVGADPSTALRDPVAKAFDLIGRCDLL